MYSATAPRWVHAWGSLIVVVLSISSCASVDTPHINSTAALGARKQALDQEILQWQTRLSQFTSEAETLIENIALLTNYPGWNDMAHIFQSFISIQYIEGAEATWRKLGRSRALWGQKWNMPWEALENKYIDLINRSGTLEQQRRILHLEWLKLYEDQRNWLRASILTLGPQMSGDMVSIGSTLFKAQYEIIEKRNNAYTSLLNKYGINKFGLYEKQ